MTLSDWDRIEPLLGRLIELEDLATRHAAAWSSQDPEQLASFYAELGSLVVNGGPPSIGRAAIAARAGEFMEAFPDMLVVMGSVHGQGGRTRFDWTWTGTNSGPGGTGRPVRISGYEEWTFSPGGRIATSNGHYDETEYERRTSGERRPALPALLRRAELPEGECSITDWPVTRC